MITGETSRHFLFMFKDNYWEDFYKKNKGKGNVTKCNKRKGRKNNKTTKRK